MLEPICKWNNPDETQQFIVSDNYSSSKTDGL